MGLWVFYFLGETYLYYRGYIGFSFFINLTFALFLIVPIPRRLRSRRLFMGMRLVAAIIAAFLILWSETRFPSILRTVKLLSETGGVSNAYIVRFLKDSVNLTQVGILALILSACIFLNKRIVLTPLAFAAILSVPLLAASVNPSDMNAYLNHFYDKESKRVVTFDRPGNNAPEFDIVILQVCSLAWDDLRMVGLDKDPFLRQFDVVFTDFNTVSPYTNPSGIRLLRADCGQERHDDLYQNGPKKCYTLDALREIGYKTYAAVDNYAPSYRFVEDIKTYGHADQPIEMRDLPLRQYDFDRSPIYDDLAILNRWWNMRQTSQAERVAFYMDITTMHAGAHWADDRAWWKRNPSVLYREFGVRLFSNLSTFFKTLEASGRNVVVIFVPEHGRALRGSSIQPPDIREIPLPSITNVPVGIKFIGKGISPLPMHQITVPGPTSYLALAYLIKSFLSAPRFDRESLLTPAIINKIPETAYVAEDRVNTVVKKDNKVFYCGKDKKWTVLPASALK